MNCRSHADGFSDGPPETTRDRFLGGLIEIDQPRSGGHRSGLDAILLAAALPPQAAGRLADLGCGVGVAGLAALALNPHLSVTLVDNDEGALKLAARNAARAAADRVRLLAADVTGERRARREAGLQPQSADFVITNPPFNPAGRSRRSPYPDRARAHTLDDEALVRWLDTATWLLAPKGELVVIVRTERLPLVLGTLTRALGGIAVLPIQARPATPALRVLVTGRQGSSAPFRILPPLVLHDETGSGFRPEAALIFQGKARIGFD